MSWWIFLVLHYLWFPRRNMVFETLWHGKFTKILILAMQQNLNILSLELLKQLYWNHTLAWVFSCKFGACFQNTFPKNTFGPLLLCINEVRQALCSEKYQNINRGRGILLSNVFFFQNNVLQSFCNFTIIKYKQTILDTYV